MRKVKSYDTLIMANLNGANAKLGSMPQWSLISRGDLAMESTMQSCQKAECEFLRPDKGGKAGMFRILEGPNQWAIIDKKETRIRVQASEHVPEVRETLNGELVEKIPLCFAHYGPISHGSKSKVRSDIAGGNDYTLDSVLGETRRADRYFRGAVIGNPSTGLTQQQLKEIDEDIRASGLGHIVYDHAWSQNPWVLAYASASANHVGEVEKALDLGASVVTVALDKSQAENYIKEYQGVAKALICPESLGKLSCNACGLCDAVERRHAIDKGRKPLIVIFLEHASGSHKRRNVDRQNNIRRWLNVSVREFDRMTDKDKRQRLFALLEQATADKRGRKEGRPKWLPRPAAVKGAIFWLFREVVP